MKSLYQAAESGDVPAIRELLARGAGVDFVESAPPRWRPMMVAALEGHVESVAVLVGAGAALNFEDLDGFTAVHLAAGRRHWEVVALLAERGADFGIMAADGRTGVDHVVRCRRRPIRDRILAILRSRHTGLTVIPHATGHTLTGMRCRLCGQLTDSCDYEWSGFGDSWDNFRHECRNPQCREVRQRTGIPGRFPKFKPEDWTVCPFCARSSDSSLGKNH
ncbi:MAG: ankyrin repeat domain-containing protein [Verrucomicrobiales bacterium]